MSFRETLRKCGIKPSRNMRDWITSERARYRKCLRRIADATPRRNWRQYLWGGFGSRGLYDEAIHLGVSIPRSLRRDFAEWQRVNEEAKHKVLEELRKELVAQ
jgi:hypothetical protein